MLQEPSAAAANPIIDTSLLAQIQVLTNQLLGGGSNSKPKEEEPEERPAPQFNKVYEYIHLIQGSRLVVAQWSKATYNLARATTKITLLDWSSVQ